MARTKVPKKGKTPKTTEATETTEPTEPKSLSGRRRVQHVQAQKCPRKRPMPSGAIPESSIDDAVDTESHSESEREDTPKKQVHFEQKDNNNNKEDSESKKTPTQKSKKSSRNNKRKNNNDNNDDDNNSNSNNNNVANKSQKISNNVDMKDDLYEMLQSVISSETLIDYIVKKLAMDNELTEDALKERISTDEDVEVELPDELLFILHNTELDTIIKRLGIKKNSKRARKLRQSSANVWENHQKEVEKECPALRSQALRHVIQSDQESQRRDYVIKNNIINNITNTDNINNNSNTNNLGDDSYITNQPMKNSDDDDDALLGTSLDQMLSAAKQSPKPNTEAAPLPKESNTASEPISKDEEDDAFLTAEDFHQMIMGTEDSTLNQVQNATQEKVPSELNSVVNNNNNNNNNINNINNTNTNNVDNQPIIVKIQKVPKQQKQQRVLSEKERKVPGTTKNNAISLEDNKNNISDWKKAKQQAQLWWDNKLYKEKIDVIGFCTTGDKGQRCIQLSWPESKLTAWIPVEYLCKENNNYKGTSFLQSYLSKSLINTYDSMESWTGCFPTKSNADLSPVIGAIKGSTNNGWTIRKLSVLEMHNVCVDSFKQQYREPFCWNPVNNFIPPEFVLNKRKTICLCYMCQAEPWNLQATNQRNNNNNNNTL
jgi:hypothetical protein